MKTIHILTMVRGSRVDHIPWTLLNLLMRNKNVNIKKITLHWLEVSQPHAALTDLEVLLGGLGFEGRWVWLTGVQTKGQRGRRPLNRSLDICAFLQGVAEDESQERLFTRHLNLGLDYPTLGRRRRSGSGQ